MEASVVSSIEEALTEAFGVPCAAVSVEPSQHGANRNSHFVVRTQDGRTYSLKCATRMGDIPADRNEYLSHHLAESLGIRGYSSSRRVPPIAGLGGVFAQRQVVAIRWHSSAAAHLDRSAASIAAAAADFLRQLGCWAAFTTMIGAANRSQENVVWDEATSTLSHCDFEDAFRAQDTLQEQLQFARTYGGLVAGAWIASDTYAPGVALASGIGEGAGMLLTHRTKILAALDADGVDPPARAKAVDWIDLPLSEKLSRARQSVG